MRNTWALLIAIGLTSACGKNTSRSSESQADRFEAFLEFYDTFHRDSLFQIAHIRFPLEGLPSNADSATLASRSFFWEREDWVLMKEFDQSTGFERRFTFLLDNLIVERIEHNSGRYAMERRWAKQGDAWYLIYYAGMNRVE